MKLSLAVALCLFGGCLPPADPLFPGASGSASQLQMRQMQTREFEAADQNFVMRAMLNALQDDGYIIRNAVPEIGLLAATKEVDLESADERFIQQLLFGAEGRWVKNSIIEATANIGPQGGKGASGLSRYRVRLTFQLKTMDNQGAVRSIQTVEDAAYYQNFFAKVDKSLFIQGQGI